MNVGARTRVALALMGQDQEWLRLRSRLGAGTIDRLLNDLRRAPSPRTVERVAEVLGVAPAWLTADATQRELTPAEQEELTQCVRTLRGLARGIRVDARGEPNAARMPERRIPRRFLALGARQVYRVLGRSLTGFGLVDGDAVYVRPLQGAHVRGAIGTLVAFRLNGARYLKQLTVAEGGVVVLRSAHPGYDPITIAEGDDWTPLGRVVASVRELG